MIAPAAMEEAPLLAALHAQAFDRPWSATEIATLLQNPTTFALISSDGPPQGFVMAWAAAGDSEILTLAVVPAARRKGVAMALMAAAGVAAAMRGAGSTHLEVAQDNAPARALYQKLGYEEAGRRPAYYAAAAGRVDAIVMRRKLSIPVV